jgi:hypothetical protein
MFPLFLFVARSFLWVYFSFFLLASLVDFLSIGLFLVRWSIYYPSVYDLAITSSLCRLLVFPVPIDLFLSPCVSYSFGKPFSSFLPLVLFPGSCPLEILQITLPILLFLFSYLSFISLAPLFVCQKYGPVFK